MKVQVIIAAGGTGERMKAPLPKPLLALDGDPVVIRTLKVFETHPLVASIILVVHEAYLNAYRDVVRDAGLQKIAVIVPGGATRTQSIRIGLRELDADTGFVMVHDAVRPFVTPEIIEEGVLSAVIQKAAVTAVPVKPTLKVVDPRTGFVRETLDRSLIWEIQTPQTFERKLLERAYEDDDEATDDASLVERIGAAVKIHMGSYRNIKITTPEDMDFAEALLKGSFQ